MAELGSVRGSLLRRRWSGCRLVAFSAPAGRDTSTDWRPYAHNATRCRQRGIPRHAGYVSYARRLVRCNNDQSITIPPVVGGCLMGHAACSSGATLLRARVCLGHAADRVFNRPFVGLYISRVSTVTGSICLLLGLLALWIFRNRRPLWRYGYAATFAIAAAACFTLAYVAWPEVLTIARLTSQAIHDPATSEAAIVDIAELLDHRIPRFACRRPFHFARSAHRRRP